MYPKPDSSKKLNKVENNNKIPSINNAYVTIKLQRFCGFVSRVIEFFITQIITAMKYIEINIPKISITNLRGKLFGIYDEKFVKINCITTKIKNFNIGLSNRIFVNP